MFLQLSVILFTGGVPGLGGGVWSRGVPAPGWQGCVWWRPPRTATAAAGMHPTEMHSCLKCKQYVVTVC